MDISIVIPIFNEEKRIKKAIDALKLYFSKRGIENEIIFVDDGSSDNTVSAVNNFSKGLNFKIISYKPNHGKGYALKQGFKDASGQYIMFMDADLSTPIEELDKFLPLMKTEMKVIIGSRKSKGAKVLKPQHAIRQKLGEGFTLLSNLLTNAQVSDYTCGFKVFENKAGKKMFKKQRIERWGYDTEILFLAKKYGYKITEIPVDWINDEQTRVNLFKDVIRSFTDLVKIRYFDFRGYYDK